MHATRPTANMRWNLLASKRTDIEGDDLSVGVEAFRDHLGQRALLVTVL